MTPPQPPNLLGIALLGLVSLVKAVLEGDKKRKRMRSKPFETRKVIGRPALPIIGGVKSLAELSCED